MATNMYLDEQLRNAWLAVLWHALTNIAVLCQPKEIAATTRLTQSNVTIDLSKTSWLLLINTSERNWLGKIQQGIGLWKLMKPHCAENTALQQGRDSSRPTQAMLKHAETNSQAHLKRYWSNPKHSGVRFPFLRVDDIEPAILIWALRWMPTVLAGQSGSNPTAPPLKDRAAARTRPRAASRSASRSGNGRTRTRSAF